MSVTCPRCGCDVCVIPKRGVLSRHPNIPGGSVCCKASLLRPSYVRMALSRDAAAREYTERRRTA